MMKWNDTKLVNFHTYLSLRKSSEAYFISMISLIYPLYCCNFLYIFLFATHSSHKFIRILLYLLQTNTYFPYSIFLFLYIHIEKKYLQSFIHAMSSSLSHFSLHIQTSFCFFSIQFLHQKEKNYMIYDVTEKGPS